MSAASAPIAIPAQPLRFAVLGGGLVATIGYLAWTLVQIQVVRHDELLEKSIQQARRTRLLPAPRGSLYDAVGTPLAVSEPVWDVVADPEYMDDKLRATIELSRLLGIPRDDLRHEFEMTSNGRVIAHNLATPEPGDPDIAAAVRALKLNGIRVERAWLRRYGQPGIAAHALGFVNDERGAAGIELSMDQQLRGENGRETVRVDARGRAIGGGGSEEVVAVAPHPGAHVRTTIDLSIQTKLEECLHSAVEKHTPAGACGIVIRPATGEILAMASWPSFDPADRRSLRPESTRNMVTGFNYEPGSTMKPLIAGAAVAEHLFSWNDVVFCENGVWTFRGRTIHDHSYKTGGHQNLSLIMGIALSDNVMMAKIGTRMGPDLLADWIFHLGFGARTGITLPGEEKGQVEARRSFSLSGACMSMPMGHQIAVTPLQLAMAHAAVANGGMWLPPKLIQRVWRNDDDGRQVELELPKLPEPRRFYSPGDAAQIQVAMTHVMDEGTGKKSQLDGYVSAGKTGTAEKIVGGRYSQESHVGSFVCWAPADPGATPAVLALVVLDDPKNGHYGGVVAAPVVRDVLQFTLEYLNIPKTEAVAENDQPAVRPVRQTRPMRSQR